MRPPQSPPSKGGDNAWRLRDGWLRFPSLEKKIGVFLGVTTRRLGDMKDPARFARAFRRAGLDPRRWTGGQQVHGRRVLWTGTPSTRPAGAPKTDGAATDAAGLALRVFAADCAAVFLIDGKGRAQALVHAGWRGARKGVVEAAIDLLRRKAGVRPGDLWMAVGPHIGECCYEVGEDVRGAFADFPLAFKAKSLTLPSAVRACGLWRLCRPPKRRGKDSEFPSPLGRRWPGGPDEGKYFFNLARVLAEKAARAGLRPERIFTDAPCTFCAGHLQREEEFFSFRRERTERRMAAVLVRRNFSRAKT